MFRLFTFVREDEFDLRTKSLPSGPCLSSIPIVHTAHNSYFERLPEATHDLNKFVAMLTTSDQDLLVTGTHASEKCQAKDTAMNLAQFLACFFSGKKFVVQMIRLVSMATTNYIFFSKL